MAAHSGRGAARAAGEAACAPALLEELAGDPTDVQWHEAMRAMRGQTLRVEVYGLDGSPHDDVPVQVGGTAGKHAKQTTTSSKPASLRASQVKPDGKLQVTRSERPIVTLEHGTSKLVVSELPGNRGMLVPRRLTANEMAALRREFGREFALVYRTGPEKIGAVVRIGSIREMSPR